MTLSDRLAITARIAACVIAGSLAGFTMWAIGALGIGSLVWAAPLLVVALLIFGLPSFGLVLAAGLLFAGSIGRNTGGWCVGLPLAAVIGWRGVEPETAHAVNGMMLVALCAIISSALFFLWSRYRPAGTVAA